MTRFAFYGRVSTEDQQDPQASRSWQLARATQLIEPAGGAVVAEYFDIGQSRSLPWKRRPEATRLLADFAAPDRPFDAVVIGEPQRAFYGAQFGLTFPVFVHHGVELWVPEVGGAVDPGSEAHDLVMTLFGGMSKGERMRIKTRVKAAMSSQAAQGRFLGGRPPYGYQLADDGPHPNPSKAAAGQRAHRLEPDPATAPIVERIFRDYLAGMGLHAIAEALTLEGVPCPSAADPARNRHRRGTAWAKTAVRAILRNPRYTGRQVWNRQRRDEVLLDVDDVAAGHVSRLRWNDRADWVWSTEEAHPPLVSVEIFTRAQQQAGAGAHRPAERKPRATPRTYLLRGLVYCGLCGRKMQGQYNHGRAHYRCKVGLDYPVDGDHPKSVYLREDRVVGPLDEWVAGLCDPASIDATVAAMAAEQGATSGDEAKAEGARRALADCDQREVKYRAALDAGADPAVVAGWLAELKGERLQAERDLASARPAATVSADQLRQLVEGLGDVASVLAEAEPADRARAYAEFGVRLTYEPSDQRVLVEASPAWGYERVGGASPTTPPPVLRGVLTLG